MRKLVVILGVSYFVRATSQGDGQQRDRKQLESFSGYAIQSEVLPADTITVMDRSRM
jgi:hypothetical protein